MFMARKAFASWKGNIPCDIQACRKITFAGSAISVNKHAECILSHKASRELQQYIQRTRADFIKCDPEADEACPPLQRELSLEKAIIHIPLDGKNRGDQFDGRVHPYRLT